MMALNSKNDWDLAAGDLLISDSGGIVSLHTQNRIIYNEINTTKPSVIGANEKIHKKIIERVKMIEL